MEKRTTKLISAYIKVSREAGKYRAILFFSEWITEPGKMWVGKMTIIIKSDKMYEVAESYHHRTREGIFDIIEESFQSLTRFIHVSLELYSSENMLMK